MIHMTYEMDVDDGNNLYQMLFDNTCMLSIGCKLMMLSTSVLCRSLSLSFSDAIDDRQWEVHALSAGFCVGARHRCRVIEEGFHV
jgi:hypothetical protein